MKKQLFSILILTILFCFVGSVYGQTKEVIKIEKIKVNFQCSNGKVYIEKGLIKAVGVVDAVADLETKIVTIKYVEGKTNKDELVKAIEKIGYTTEYTKEGTPNKSACSKVCPESRPKP